MKIESNKVYKLEDGTKVCLADSTYVNEYWPWVVPYEKSSTGKLYINEEGFTQDGFSDYTTPNVLSEWVDKPEEVGTGRVIVDITDKIDDIIRKDLEWHVMEMLKENYDPHETLDNKVEEFNALCRVIKHYSRPSEYEQFQEKLKGKKLK